MARLALLALLTGAARSCRPAPLPARPPRRRALADARRHGHGGHVLGGRGAACPTFWATRERAVGPLGPMSGIFLLVGLPRVSASQLGAPLTAATANPFYIAGSLCVPVSRGLHAARGIQKKNPP